MGWKQDRDLLIAQTLAFVHSVTGKSNDAVTSEIEQRPDTGPDAEAAQAEAAEIRAVEIIHAPAAPPRAIEVELPRQLEVLQPRMAVSSDIRSEMRARVASFRAHQQRFEREREQYCSATLIKVRAALGNFGAPDGSAGRQP